MEIVLAFLFLAAPVAVLVWAIRWFWVDSRRRFNRRHQANINYRNRHRR